VFDPTSRTPSLMVTTVLSPGGTYPVPVATSRARSATLPDGRETSLDDARTWVEQASPQLGETPLIMVLSAGAEPLMRPYYEALRPQVDAVLSGIPSAVAYEEANDLPGAARELWDGFGMGMLTAELVLVIGAVYGLVSWLKRPRGT